MGAYVLATELATLPSHIEAFAAYQQTMRRFVELNQAFATAEGATVFPIPERALAEHNKQLGQLSTLPGRDTRPEHFALTLPDVADVSRPHA